MKKISILSALLSLSVLGSCFTPSTNEPSESPSVTPTKQPSSTPTKPKDGVLLNLVDGIVTVGGLIKDAKTGEVLDKNIKVVFDGKDKDKLEKLSLESKTGQFTFTLKKGVKPSKENPIVVKAIVEADGYFSSSEDLEITSDSTNVFDIKLVNVKSPPQGVNTNEKQLVLNNGKLNENVTINLLNNSNNTKASLNIKPDTIMRDRSGNVLTGNMNMEVGFFDSQDPNSLQAFPGGFRATVTSTGENSGFFTTGGFLSVRIKDSTGKEVSTFSNPIDIDMTMPKGTINPETKQPLKVGDTIGVWSYDENTGKWKFENTAKVNGTDSNGNFTLKFTASHLSYWNLDWFDDNTCNPKLKFKWKNNKKYYPVEVKVEFEGIGTQPWVHDGHLEDDENFLYNFPTDRPIKFMFSANGIDLQTKTVTLKPKSTNNNKQYWWERGRECQGDIEVDIDIEKVKLPKIVKLPYEIYFKVQNLFNKDEFKEFLEKLAFLSSSEAESIVNAIYTDNNQKSISETDYTKLQSAGINSFTILRIKNALENKYYPVIPVWYRNSTKGSDWRLAYTNAGYWGGSEGHTFFVGDKYEFKVIYEGQEYKQEGVSKL
jgi:hypothetical protein